MRLQIRVAGCRLVRQGKWNSTLIATALAAVFATGCASTRNSAAPPKVEKTDEIKEESEANRAQLAEFRNLLNNLTQRMESMETRLNSLNEKTSATKSSLDTLLANGKGQLVGVQKHPGDVGARPAANPAPSDPEAGFLNDEAIQGYRKAIILLEAQKFAEAALVFSAFLEKYPDHPLAGNAQYFVGHAYLKRKEYKIAANEYQRVLTSYDRSSRVADTLREIAEAEDHLKMPEQAARHRQLLTSLFPQSPASSLSKAAEPAPATEEAPVHDPAAPEPSKADPVPAPAAKVEALPTAPITATKTSSTSAAHHLESAKEDQ